MKKPFTLEEYQKQVFFNKKGRFLWTQELKNWQKT